MPSTKIGAEPTPAPLAPVAVLSATQPKGRRFAFILALAILLIVFARDLRALGTFAGSNSLYSHIPLIPIVSLYLIWNRRKTLPPATEPAWALGAIAAALAAGLCVARWQELGSTLTLAVSALVLLVVTATGWCFGQSRLRALSFPLGFLIFAIPLPPSWLLAIQTMLQHGSAAVAHALFALMGTPVLYQDLMFQLPGINIQVAPECSGIHSTLALLMVSTLAAHTFLRTTSRAWILGLAVLPLALVRNGFRIFVVGELCVHRGPAMIDSPIHRQGGPVFFALSLVPFLFLLWLLIRSERRVSA